MRTYEALPITTFERYCDIGVRNVLMLLFSLVLVIENAVLLNIVAFEVETVTKLLVLLTI